MNFSKLARIFVLIFSLITQISVAETKGLKEDGKAAIEKVFSEVTVSQPVCFGREYSANHMNANPLKTIRKMSAKFATEPKYNTESLHLELSIKGEKNKFKVYQADLYCLRSEGLCAIECDGGSVYLKMESKSRMQVINQGFMAEGGCDGEDGDKNLFIEAIKGGDDIFNLARLPAEFCKNN